VGRVFSGCSKELIESFFLTQVVCSERRWNGALIVFAAQQPAAGRPALAEGSPIAPNQVSIVSPKCPNSGENVMKTKLNEDWLATIIGIALLFLAMLGVIAPTWMVF
jgi:hypothetical protein